MLFGTPPFSGASGLSPALALGACAALLITTGAYKAASHTVSREELSTTLAALTHGVELLRARVESMSVSLLMDRSGENPLEDEWDFNTADWTAPAAYATYHQFVQSCDWSEPMTVGEMTARSRRSICRSRRRNGSCSR